MIEMSAVFENLWLDDARGGRQIVLSSQSIHRLMESVAVLMGRHPNTALQPAGETALAHHCQ